jgi:hypothetical protein
MSQPPGPTDPPTWPLAQPVPPQGMQQQWQQPPWPQQGMPPGGQWPPGGPIPLQQQPQKAKRVGWPTLIITAVVALGLGGLIGGLIGSSGDRTATTEEPNTTVTATETVTAEPEPAPTAAKAPTTKNTTKPESKSTMGEGTYEIGVDAKPGRYKTRVPEDSPVCYWEKTKDDTGDFDSLIANAELEPGARASVTVKSGDFFHSEDCGTWTMV